MPLLDPLNMGNSKLVTLDASLYGGSGGIQSDSAGIGLTDDAYRDMDLLMAGHNTSIATLEKLLNDSTVTPGSNPLSGTTSIQQQAFMSNRMTMLEEIRAHALAREQQAQARNRAMLHTPVSSSDTVVLRGSQPLLSNQSSTAFVDLRSVVHEVQQGARTCFTSGQSLRQARWLTEWLTLVEVLITCAANAEAEMTGVVAEVNAQRQAMWKLAGEVIGTVLTFGAPPPFGMIIGGVVKAVFTADTWTGCLASSGAAAMSANFPKMEEQWKKNEQETDEKKMWGPTQERVYKSIETTKAPGGQETLADYKDIPDIINSATMCLGAPAQEMLKKINEKTLMHVTDMPEPDSKMGKPAVEEIRKHVAKMVDLIQQSVEEKIAEYAGSQKGAEALVAASFKYQQDSLRNVMRSTGSSSERSHKVRAYVRQGAQYFLNTTAHNIMLTLTKNGKPKYNVTTIDKELIKNKFCIMFWAAYLGGPCLDKSKADKSAPLGDELYWAKEIGVIKKLSWNDRIAAELVKLGIAKQYPSKTWSVFDRTTRTPEYIAALRNWEPPVPQIDFSPVPFQDGGSEAAKGRIAAWAVGYNKRGPEELIKAICAEP